MAAARALRNDKTQRVSLGQVFDIFGAGERNRTLDLLITNELLYQLSYTGVSRETRLPRTA